MIATHPVKSDPSWIPGFRDRYAAWWPDAAPLLERHEYAAAFKSYPWPVFQSAPWTPVVKPLAASRIALVTTGGLHHPGDPPFDAGAPAGDPGFRRLAASTPIASLGIAHDHFPHEVARADMNSIFPLDRLRDLAADGLIAGVAETHFSIMGYCPRAADLAEGAAPAIAAGLRAEAVDLVVIAPV